MFVGGKEKRYVSCCDLFINSSQRRAERVRLEDEGNQMQCLLVLIGTRAQGRKELIAVINGVRGGERREGGESVGVTTLL